MSSIWQRQQAAWCLALLLVGAWRLAGAQQIETVTDLKQRIYTDMPLGHGHSGDACVRLLWAGGVVGCAAPTGQEATEGRLLRLTQLRQPDEYPDEAVYLLPPELLADFLLQCQDQPSVAARVRGVLSEPLPAPGYSQAAATPLAEFALYSNKYYAWNPTGKGLNSLAIPFPVFLLDNDTAQSAQERAVYNEEQHMNGALHFARMHLSMEAAGSGNSSACLADRSCLPVGGHSVLAALPALPPPATAGAAGGTAAAASGDDLPSIWILSQFDSSALFHEAAVGAESPVSGLIAMLAAAELLGSGNASSAVGQYRQRYCRRLVFAALGGEPWGMMGSKRLLWEAANGSSALAGLGVTSDRMSAVLEVGQVGRGQRTQQGGSIQEVQLFAHTPAGGAAAAAGMLAALQAAAGMLNNGSSGGGGGGESGSGPGGSVTVTAASPSLPGLPPTASSGSFVRVLGSAAGTAGAAGVPALLLADFEAAFQGDTFQSHYDTMQGVDADSIASAAVVLAQAAHSLALAGPDGAACGGNGTAAGGAGQGGGEVPPLPVDYVAVKETVEALMQCLLNSTLGLNCPLARAMMTPVSGGKVGHYVGILRSLTADPQEADANIKSDFERFIWNWLAFATRPKPANSSSNGTSGGGGGTIGSASAADADLQRCQPLNVTACPAGFVCAGSRSIKGAEGEGFCLNATLRYIPSYSTSLLCDGCDGAKTDYEFRWKLTDAAAQWEQQHGWPPDQLWTESNWPSSTPSLTLFLKEDPWVENVLLGVGLAVAAASVAAVVGTRAAFHRKLKRQ